MAAMGVAGRSAQAEGDRRVEARERRIRSRFPHIGGLILVITKPPQTTTAWFSGAIGERKVGARLAKPAELGKVTVLHDRQVPRSRGNIDHIVVGPAGVYVIDTKRYVRSKVERRSNGKLFRKSPARLFVGDRDMTKLVEAMDWQMSAVQNALRDLDQPSVPAVMSALCFVDANWPLISGTFDIEGTHVTGPRGLIAHASRPGPLDQAERAAIGRYLAERLPEA